MSENQAKKIGLVVEGGGMKCAYSAGILDRFLDDGITFPYCIGVSAGAANLSSFLAGQRGRSLNFFTTYVSNSEYFGAKPFLKNGNLFNLEYIYSTISNSDGIYPLDYETLRDNPAEFKVVATDARTGRPHYFDKSDIKQDDYSVIRASSAIPAACRPVAVKGRFFVDGGVSDSIPFRRAMSADGCDKVVVITSKPRDFVKKPQENRELYRTMCASYPEVIRALDRRHIMYNRELKEMHELEKEGKLFLFAPSRSLPMGTYDMNAQANLALYHLGLLDYRERKEELTAFLEDRE